jgi:hypothetical protein
MARNNFHSSKDTSRGKKREEEGERKEERWI